MKQISLLRKGEAKLKKFMWKGKTTRMNPKMLGWN